MVKNKPTFLLKDIEAPLSFEFFCSSALKSAGFCVFSHSWLICDFIGMLYDLYDSVNKPCCFSQNMLKKKPSQLLVDIPKKPT